MQPVIGDKVAVAVGATFLVPGERAEEFVVATPQRDAGVVVEAGDLFAHLCVDVGQECFGRRVEVASEHEVVPDQQAKFVADVVEPIGLVSSAAPATDLVNDGINR